MGDMADLEIMNQLDPFDDGSENEPDYGFVQRMDAWSGEKADWEPARARGALPGYWVGRFNKSYRIADMTTAHLVNTIKLLDRKAWMTVGNSSKHKAAVKACVRRDPTYCELEAELMLRLSDGRATVSDFLPNAHGGWKKLHVTEVTSNQVRR